MSFYSHNETSLAMSTLALWCRLVRSRDVSLHNFDGLAMSCLAFSVAFKIARHEIAGDDNDGPNCRA